MFSRALLHLKLPGHTAAIEERHVSSLASPNVQVPVIAQAQMCLFSQAISLNKCIPCLAKSLVCVSVSEHQPGAD